MRIGGIGPASGTTRHATNRRDDEIAEPRALIAVEAAAPTERLLLVTRHPEAPFLAHLIATKMQAPQTRARRRAEPEDVAALYGVTAAVTAAQRTLKRA